MKTRTIGLWTVVALVVLLLVLTTVGFAKPAAKGQNLKTTKDLEGRVLAGVAAARLPEENAEVLFETILGIRLSGYHAAKDLPALLYELRSGRTDAVCCPDVTADYLLRTEEGLSRLLAPEDTSNGVVGGGRLSFAMALRKGEDALCEELSVTISEMEEDGILEAITYAYVDAKEPLALYASGGGGGRRLYVGVTGTIPPIDRLDANGKPCGFSVAFLEELGKRTGYQFEPVVLTTKESFTALNSGRVDLLFAYGTSRNTTPGEKEYLVTRGYYTMQEYAYLVLQ